MNTNQILGMAFTVMVTNFHHQTIRSMKCPVKDCTIVHHFEVEDVFHVSKEEHVYVVGMNGDPFEHVLQSAPERAFMLTNYFSDLNAIQRRGRVAPMPVVPRGVLTNTASAEWERVRSNTINGSSLPDSHLLDRRLAESPTNHALILKTDHVRSLDNLGGQSIKP